MSLLPPPLQTLCRWPTPTCVCLFLILAGGGFVAGARYGYSHAGSNTMAGERTVLYYVDPMNPEHTTARPGFAPCGMKMQPVYADPIVPIPSQTPACGLGAGMVQISLKQQQLIGVQLGMVQAKPAGRMMRLAGKVELDETQLYRINAAVDGRIAVTAPWPVGSPVQKSATMGSYYSSEFQRAGQALAFTLNALERVRSNQEEVPATAGSQSLPGGSNSAASSSNRQRSPLDYTSQVSQLEVTLKQSTAALRSFGMDEPQLQELIHSRQPLETIDLTSPVDGFIVSRNVSVGQNFEKGTELFRIADLSNVWIVVEPVEGEAELVHSGLVVQVALPPRTNVLTTKLARVLPLFDPEARPGRVRLEMENPARLLRPGMLVDLEINVCLPAACWVPVNSVLNSGRTATVFVQRGEGIFEPRLVRTGRHIGSEVEIVQGIAPGEQIVTSGNFLLDSESRMKLAGSQPLQQ